MGTLFQDFLLELDYISFFFPKKQVILHSPGQAADSKSNGCNLSYLTDTYPRDCPPACIRQRCHRINYTARKQAFCSFLETTKHPEIYLSSRLAFPTEAHSQTIQQFKLCWFYTCWSKVL